MWQWEYNNVEVRRSGNGQVVTFKEWFLDDGEPIKFQSMSGFAQRWALGDARRAGEAGGGPMTSQRLSRRGTSFSCAIEIDCVFCDSCACTLK